MLLDRTFFIYGHLKLISRFVFLWLTRIINIRKIICWKILACTKNFTYCYWFWIALNLIIFTGLPNTLKVSVHSVIANCWSALFILRRYSTLLKAFWNNCLKEIPYKFDASHKPLRRWERINCVVFVKGCEIVIPSSS